jgi:hypothetical protein
VRLLFIICASRNLIQCFLFSLSFEEVKLLLLLVRVYNWETERKSFWRRLHFLLYARLNNNKYVYAYLDGASFFFISCLISTHWRRRSTLFCMEMDDMVFSTCLISSKSAKVVSLFSPLACRIRTYVCVHQSRINPEQPWLVSIKMISASWTCQIHTLHLQVDVFVYITYSFTV